MDGPDNGNQKGPGTTVVGKIKDRYLEIYSSLDYGPIATARGLMGALFCTQTLPPMKTLCVGSGNAYEAVCFRQNAFDVYTVDYYCPKVKILTGRQIIGQGQQLPFRDDAFELVFSAECIEHIPETDIDVFMLELKRVGKIFRFTIDDNDDPPYHTHQCIHEIDWWMEHFNKWGYWGIFVKPQTYHLKIGDTTKASFDKGFRFEGSKVIP